MAFTVYTGTDETTLIDALLAPDAGIVIDTNSIVLDASGQEAVNFYDGSLAALGIGDGLLLTSGTTPGTSNTVGWFGTDNSIWPTTFYNGDADIDAVVNTVFSTQSYDATTLSFDFTVTDQTATSVSFDVVFGTDEFPEWVDQFVDCAIVMVNGVNYALFNHDPLHPLSVVSSNLAAGYFQDNAGNVLPIEYDGVSHVLKIVAPINAGEVNHIKIGIADTGDHIYDSGIFISNLTAGYIPGSGVVVTSPDSCTDSSDTVTGSSKDEYFDLKGGDDICYAGLGDDIVVGGNGNDTVYGGSGADQLKGDAGDDSLDGGADADTAVYSGAWANGTGNYSFASLGASFTISDTSAIEGTDTLTNIEFAKFSDGLFALSAGGLALVNDPAPAPTNTPGLVMISGIGAEGNTLTATVSDADGVSGPVSYQWQVSADNGATWSDLSGAIGNTYSVLATDVGADIQVLASYVDNGAQTESLVSAAKAIQETNNGDLIVTLMQLTAPTGAIVINPLTTLVQDAVDLGLSPNMAALAIKTGLGLPADISLQSYDAYAILQANPNELTALAVEKVAVQVAILTSLFDDDTGVNLTLKILDAAANNQTLDLANIDALSAILGIPAVIDPISGKYPEPLNEIYDRNKTMSDAIDDVLGGGGAAGATGLSVIENEWQDLLSIQDGIDSTSIADLSIHVNQAPTGSAVAVLDNGLENTAYIVSGSNLLLGFNDPDGDALSVVGLSADNGTVLDNGDGTFTITPILNYSGPVELTYTVDDGQGGTTAASQLFVVSVDATGADNEATGTLNVTGTAQEGGALSASLTNVIDADGATTPAYQWQENLAGAWTDIAGANTGTLDIPADQSFVGKEVRVVATSNDVLGGTTAFAGTGQTIANVDDEAAGTLGVVGAAQDGGSLTANLTAVIDADGATTTAYQWQENVAGAWTEINGANTDTLTIPADQSYVGKEVRVVATSTDALGGTSVFEGPAQTVTAIAGVTLTGTAGADVLNGGSGDDSLSGLGGTDTLNGLAGDDTLNAGSGNDSVSGGDGNDLLEGGLGADILNGDAGIDTASYLNSTKAVSVNLQANKFSGGDAQGDHLYGIENLTGSAFNDTLVGNAGANALSGGGGSDVLRGLGGTDELYGGGGADTFDFDAITDSGLGANADLILDFALGIDKIDLSTIDANTLVNKNQAFNGTLLNGLSADFTAASQLRYEYSGGTDTTVVQGNTDGIVATAEFEIHLLGNIALTAEAFVL